MGHWPRRTASLTAVIDAAIEAVFAGRHGPFVADNLVFWIGGQGTVPYEQKTQQSPFLGFNSSPQPSQS